MNRGNVGHLYVPLPGWSVLHLLLAWHRLPTFLAAWTRQGPLWRLPERRFYAKSDVVNEIVGGSLKFCCFRFQETERIWGYKGVHPCMASPSRLTQREILAQSPLFKAPPLRRATASQHRCLESELGFTLNWLLSQENNFFFSFSFSLPVTWCLFWLGNGTPWVQGEPEVCSRSVKPLWWWE